MRVHLSPWEIAETSLGVAAKKRRRKSLDSNGSSNSEYLSSASPLVGLAARFVSSRRSGASKIPRANQAEKLVPKLVLTGEHCISVVGTSSDSSLRESEMLQYLSRSGQTHSFLSTAVAASEIGSAPSAQIPAIYDGNFELVYAFQKNNTRLLCWPAASGPDQAQTLALTSPAVDLALVRQPTGIVLVCGSCQDGRVFLVKTTWVQKQQALSLAIAYIQPKEKDMEGRYVVGTLVRPVAGKELNPTGAKRKIHAMTGEPESLLVYQLAVEKEKSGIVLICHYVALCLEDSGLQASIRKTRISCMPLPASDLKSQYIHSVFMVGLCEHKNAMVVSYTLENSHRVKENGHFSVKQRRLYTLFSLETGAIIVSPTELPLDTLHLGLVSSRVLALGTHEDIVLVDLLRGGRLYQQALPDRKRDSGYAMIADDTRAQLSILFVQNECNDKASVAVPCGEFLAKLKSLTQQPANLASGIAASLLVSKHTAIATTTTRQVLRDRKVLTFGFLGRNGTTAHHSRMENGMVVEMKQNVAAMLKAYSLVLDEDSSEASVTVVECAANMVVNVLCNVGGKTPQSIQFEAGRLLRGLIRTKKLLARLHLPPSSFTKLLRALESKEPANCETSYSPFDLILDVFTFCPDASERHMIAALHFLLCRAAPDDVARSLRHQPDEQLRNMSAQYLSMRNSETHLYADSGKVKVLSTKVVQAGISFVLKRILSYSFCNDGLLRRALSDGLGRQEMGLLMRLLETVPFSLPSIQWLSALCTCLDGEPSHTVNVLRIRKRIALERSTTEAILALHSLLDVRGVASSKLEVNSVSPTQIPPYQIERLLF
jgi:hypothetical protein